MTSIPAPPDGWSIEPIEGDGDGQPLNPDDLRFRSPDGETVLSFDEMVEAGHLPEP